MIRIARLIMACIFWVDDRNGFPLMEEKRDMSVHIKKHPPYAASLDFMGLQCG